MKNYLFFVFFYGFFLDFIHFCHFLLLKLVTTLNDIKFSKKKLQVLFQICSYSFVFRFTVKAIEIIRQNSEAANIL